MSASFSAAKKLKELERANIAFKSKVDIRDKQSYLLNDRIKIISQKNVSAMFQLENRKPLQIFYLQGFIFIVLYPDPGSNRDGSESTGV